MATMTHNVNISTDDQQGYITIDAFKNTQRICPVLNKLENRDGIKGELLCVSL